MMSNGSGRARRWARRWRAGVGTSLAVALLASGSLVAVTPDATAAAPARSEVAKAPAVKGRASTDLQGPCQQTGALVICDYTYTSANTIQSFVVPNGVTSVTAYVTGAQGGNGNGDGAGSGGNGGFQNATISVSGGEALQMLVGQQGTGSQGGGAGGWPNGGSGGNVNNVNTDGCGGGGSSEVEDGNGTILLVGAGGGGCGGTVGSNESGGGGGNAGTSPGGGGDGGSASGCHYAGYGGGAANSNGGGGGGGEGQYFNFGCQGGGDQSFAVGQPGGGLPNGSGSGGNGGQGRTQDYQTGSGGGGGGGYYGGGGGGGGNDFGSSLVSGGGGGGGGGIDYVDPNTSEVQGLAGGTTGQGGNGFVEIEYQLGTSMIGLASSAGDGAPAYANEPDTLTATVDTSQGDPAGGTVDFENDGTTISGCGDAVISDTTATSGIATCHWAATPSQITSGATVNDLTATYSGNGGVEASAPSQTFVYDVVADPTVTDVQEAKLTDDTSFTGTAAVRGAYYADVQGTVSFTAAPTSGSGQTVSLCANVPSPPTSQPVSIFTVDCNASNLTGLLPGIEYTVTATFSPASGTGVASSSGSQVVNSPKAPTAVTVTSPTAGQTVTYGSPLTYTATVTSSPATTINDGTIVVFAEESSQQSPFQLCQTPQVANGTASCTGQPLNAGQYVITAYYTGGATTESSPISSGVNLVVAQATPTIMVTANQSSPVAAGVPVELTATATSSGGAPVFQGVSFVATEGSTSTTICNTSFGRSGTASCAWDPLPGTYTVSAVYGGNTDYAASTGYLGGSSTSTFVVDAGSSTTTLSPVTPASLANPVPAGTAVTVAATVTSSAASVAPTGTVAFYDDGQPIASCGGAAGEALQSPTQCTWTPTAGTTHTVTAVYSGDTNTSGSSTTTPLDVQVSAASTTTSLLVSPPSPVFGQPIDLSASVTSGGAAVTDGTVEFLEDGNQITTCSAVAVDSTGTAPCTVEPSAGPHTFTASYLGGTTTGPSSSGPSDVTVGADPTSTSVAAAVNTQGTTTLTATVTASTAGGAAPGSPTGTVTISVDGTAPAGCSDLSLPAGDGTSAVQSCDWTSTPGPHTLAATYTPLDGSFAASSGSESYTPPAVCSAGYASIYKALAANGSVSLSNSTLGASLTATATASGPCDPGTAIPFTVSGSLFKGSLSTVGVAGNISQDGGICFTSGALSLPAAWKIANPTITVPVCFAITDSGGLGAPTSGTLTSGTSKISLPFVDLPEIPASTLTVTFAPSSVSINFAAGRSTSGSASADLAVTIDGTGAYNGTLTTTNLSLFGQPLSLSGSVTGGGGAVPTVTASASLGTVHLVTGLTLDGVTVTATNTGLAIAASATLGGSVPLTVQVSGTISAENTWTLDLSGTTTTWKPISSLAVNASFTGSVSDAAGTLSYSLSAGTPGQEAVSWSPGAGINVTLTTITLQSATTACDGSTIAGSGDPLLTLSGSVAIGSHGAALAGCVDLAQGTFQLGATADSAITVTSGFSIANLALTLAGGAGQGASLTGTATATVLAGGKTVTAPIALEVTTSGALTLVGSVDLTQLGIPVTGYVAYSSAAVTGFVVDPATGATVDLPAGVSAQGTYTPGSTVTALLQQAGFTLPAGGAITFLAALSPTGAITFNGQLTGPGSLPFLTLPGGAALQSATLSYSGGVLQIGATATFPVPGVTAPATATLAVTINTSSGAFSGSGTVDGLVLFGQPVHLSGAISGTPDPSTGKDTITASITGTIAGPFSPPNLPLLSISGLSVTLGTSGIQLAGTLSAANLGSLSLTGTLASLSNWSISVVGTAAGWQPDPSISINATVSGTLTDKAGTLSYDITATPTNGAANVATFTPTSGVTLGVASVELSNGSTLPTGCTVAAAGDTWLDVNGDLGASFSGQELSAIASGCFDLTAKTFELSAGLTGSISALNGDVTVSSPTLTITKAKSGFTVDGMASLTVQMPVGGTFNATLDLAYEGSGNFVVGSSVNLTQYLGSIGAAGYLYYSSSAVNGFQTGDPTLGAINLAQGVSFALDVSLPQSEDTTLTHLGISVPNGSIAAIGTVNFASDVFTLRLQFNAGLNGQALFTTASGITLKLDSGFLQLSIGGDQASFSIGLTAELDLPAVDPGASSSVVPLTGLLTFSTEEIDASLSVGTCNDPADAWQNAFGITGLSVECATVQGGLSLEGIPFPSFGFSGTINGLPTTVANAIGYVNNAPISFAFNLDPLLLSLSIGTKDSTTPALEPFAAFGQGNLAQVFYASVYISPTGATIGSTVYPAGFGFGFQANLDGVSVDILAQLDPNTPSLSFSANISAITIGALTVGPVAVDLQASPSNFSFTLDASLQLGPGTAQIGPALSIGGELAGSISVSLGSTGLSAYITASAQVTLGAYISQETCSDDGLLYPCDYMWEYTSFGFNLAKTGFSVTASGLTLSWNGSSIFLPWPSTSGPEHSTLAARGTPTVLHLDGQAARTVAPGTGSWASSAALPTGTAFAATAVLPSGKLLVAGGEGPSGPSRSAEIRNPTTGAWTQVADLHQARVGATATVLPDGTVLVAGGRNGHGALPTAEVFHPATGTWTRTGRMTAATSYGTASLLPDGMVLVAGGEGAGHPLAGAQLYDPATGTWTATGSLGTARGQQTATVLPGGDVLVAGGQGAHGPLSSTELYDPATGTWSPGASMHFARKGASAVVLKDGTVLMTGDASNAEVYDPTAGTWTITAPEPEARTDANAALLPDGRVVVVGGTVAAGPKQPALTVATTEVYDPVTELWAAGAPRPDAGAGAASAVLPGGDVVVAGGELAPGSVEAATSVYTPPPAVELPWPSQVQGQPKVTPGGPSGFSLGQSGNQWKLVATHPGPKVQYFTGTITLNRGTFSNVKAFQLEPRDQYSINGSTLTFAFRNTGFLDGLLFTTPRGATVLAANLFINGTQATDAQVALGSHGTHPSVANPVTVIRQGAVPVTGAS